MYGTSTRWVNVQPFSKRQGTYRRGSSFHWIEPSVLRWKSSQFWTETGSSSPAETGSAATMRKATVTARSATVSFISRESEGQPASQPRGLRLTRRLVAQRPPNQRDVLAQRIHLAREPRRWPQLTRGMLDV